MEEYTGCTGGCDGCCRNCPRCREESIMPASGVPVSTARVGERGTIVGISGKEEVRRYLNDLGFTPGAEFRAVCQADGNMILDVRGSKIAIDRRMANRILFCPAS